ncbi:MAG: 50S ribosomal protein L32 [bacterium]|nr:50S ribosomal protein L32 [bacterium]
MSVPAFRNSKAKVRRRRQHHKLKPTHIVIDKVTGEPRLPHHHNATTGVPAAAEVKKTETKTKKPAPKKNAKKPSNGSEKTEE